MSAGGCGMEMQASLELAGMLNSYLSISFHLSVKICADVLLILLIYRAFFFVSREQGVEAGGCDDTSEAKCGNCLRPLGAKLITPFTIFNLFVFPALYKFQSYGCTSLLVAPPKTIRLAL